MATEALALVLQVTEEDGSVRSVSAAELERLPGAELQALARETVTEFNDFFTTKVENDAPLMESERALLNTFIWWLTHPTARAGETAKKADDAEETGL